MGRTRLDGTSSTENENMPQQFDLTFPDVRQSVSHSELVKEQCADSSLKDLMESVLPGGEVKNCAQCYFLQIDVLMRKLVPQGFRSMMLQVSHHITKSGHLGVRETYDCILRYFFWPPLKRDVSPYIKSCHTCQLMSEPNQSCSTVHNTSYKSAF